MTTFIIRIIVPLLASLIVSGGLYWKGRIDGYNSCVEKSIKQENKQLIDALKKLEDNSETIERLKKNAQNLNSFNRELEGIIRDAKKELPNDDRDCNFSRSITDRLRDAENNANSKVFGEPSN